MSGFYLESKFLFRRDAKPPKPTTPSLIFVVHNASPLRKKQDCKVFLTACSRDHVTRFPDDEHVTNMNQIETNIGDFGGEMCRCSTTSSSCHSSHVHMQEPRGHVPTWAERKTRRQTRRWRCWPWRKVVQFAFVWVKLWWSACQCVHFVWNNAAFLSVLIQCVHWDRLCEGRIECFYPHVATLKGVMWLEL